MVACYLGCGPFSGAHSGSMWCACAIPDRAHSGGVINSQIEPTQFSHSGVWQIEHTRPVCVADRAHWQIEHTQWLSPCSEGPGMINSLQVNALREVCMVSTGQAHALREVCMVSTGQAHALREVCMVSGANCL